MIRIENLTKRFDDVIAINNLSLNIEKGINGLIGENGAGKSTLLRLIADIYQKDEGNIFIDDFDNKEIDAKKNVFYLSDSPFFDSHSSPNTVIKLYDSLFDIDKDKYVSLMEKLSLPLNRSLSTFSKGMRRQFFLVLALSMKAKYILLDEAFDGVDPLMQQTIKDAIIEESKDKVFLIASHNIISLERLCDNFILLSKGEMKKSGVKEDLGKAFKKYQILFEIEVDEATLLNNGIKVVSFKKSGSICHIVLDSDEMVELLKEKFKIKLMESVAIDKDELAALEMLSARAEVKK